MNKYLIRHCNFLGYTFIIYGLKGLSFLHVKITKNDIIIDRHMYNIGQWFNSESLNILFFSEELDFFKNCNSPYNEDIHIMTFMSQYLRIFLFTFVYLFVSRQLEI